MSKLGDYLNSINSNKKNIIRGCEPLNVAEKLYPPFPVARSLSYHPDAIFAVNELNALGLAGHKLRPLMHYEFLLYELPRRNRFSKWGKPIKDAKIDAIKQYYKYSTEKALEIIDLIDDDAYKAILEELDVGGTM